MIRFFVDKLNNPTTYNSKPISVNNNPFRYNPLSFGSANFLPPCNTFS